jgi:hypothetical protein
MLWGESNVFRGRLDIAETQQVLARTVANRLGDNTYFPGINTWQQALVPSQYLSLNRTDLPINGVQPELFNAGTVFERVYYCGSVRRSMFLFTHFDGMGAVHSACFEHWDSRDPTSAGCGKIAK